MELLTVKEMAQRLRIAPTTLRQWAKEGLVPAVRVNPKITRYDPAEVVQALKDRMETAHAN